MRKRIKKGLDIRISGEPRQEIDQGNTITQVAVVGRDFNGLKPRMQVAEGDHVVLGQPLFSDRKNPGVRFVAPGTGKITSINRGERRILQSVVITLDDTGHDANAASFDARQPAELDQLNSDQVRETLIASGLWVAFRSRPYSKVPAIDSDPDAIFVTATDTNPLAPDPQVVIARNSDHFQNGLKVLCRLANVPVHVCTGFDSDIPTPELPNLKRSEFAGPHPSGLAGTHIHFIYPVNESRLVYTIRYQDVIAIGHLFTTGSLMTERVISLAGPLVDNPRLVTTRWGAHTSDIIAREVPKIPSRVISGSVLGGRRAAGWGAFLGRNHYQVTVLAEGEPREMFGWITPGWNKYSFWRIFLSNIFGGRRRFDLNTSQHGSARAMVPIGQYESVVPMDILPTQLLRALLVKDTVNAQELGCLELSEEDLALCSFVCPSKYNYGPVLRANLEQIEKEG